MSLNNEGSAFNQDQSNASKLKTMQPQNLGKTKEFEIPMKKKDGQGQLVGKRSRAGAGG